MGKMSPTLLSIILLFVEFEILCLAKNISFGCVSGERKALLKFKSSLVDPSNRLSSWKGTNCCNWEGVSCHKITGHVVKLDLSHDRSTDPIISSLDAGPVARSDHSLRSNSLDSSLLELKHLNYLDLSQNAFVTEIPTFLGSMKLLQHLNLSGAKFQGIVPHHLGNLSNLRTLAIGNHGLIADDIRWISNLSSLEYLDLDGTNLSRTKDLIKVLSMFPSLVMLRLRDTALNNNHLPNSCVNSTLLPHVKYLDMGENSFNGEIPCFFHNMTSLEFLDLSFNQYNSTAQPFLRLEKLVHVNLGGNHLHHLTDWVSELLGNNCQLKSLDLSFNQFNGGISGAFNNLSGCRIYELESLHLDNNGFNGSIPESIGKLSALVTLDISRNELSGSIPESVGNLTALRELFLHSNQLSGEIPTSLGQLSNLESIDISVNSFNGTLSEAHFSNLSKLKNLYATSNSIKFKVGKNWMPPFQLESLFTPSCNMEGDQFPSWLQTQKALTELDLSNCNISGSLPKWLGGKNLTHLALSKNHISGTIPELSSSISVLDLSDNMINHLPSDIGHMLPLLQGLYLAGNVINSSLPNSLCRMKGLAYLHLSSNYLSGNLPHCWQNFPNLMYVGLSSNELSGIIPKSIGGVTSLRVLRLDNNHFRGKLPSTLKNCRFLEILDVGENKLYGEITEWIGNHLPGLKILRLRNNEFRGVIPQALCQASDLQILDLGINKLTGYIPDCFRNFSGMIHPDMYSIFSLYDPKGRDDSLHQMLKGVERGYSRNPLTYLANLDLSCNNLVGGIPSELTALVGLQGLNLSHNNLQGEIPRMIGSLKLVSLDLSNNHLFGKIPESLTNLTSLSHLNLSNNYLSGRIPIGCQLQTLDDAPSIYAGNPLLCGDPLPKQCQSYQTPKHTNAQNHGAVDADTIDKLFFYAFVIGGFASGLWGFFGILFFKRNWRHAYFHFVEVVIRKMLRR